ncbi:MAG: hypothetical protein JWR67_2803 [Mucilaginibacter sp.]|nr:hypothetical protein [Mucilaginibacter sp.]
MENIEESQSKNFTLSLSNAAQLASLALALGIAFSIIRNYLYYVLFLHVPIFQYLSLSDIVLIAPSGIFWAIYFSSMDAVNNLSKSSQFSVLEKFFYAILLCAFAGFLTWLGFHNEPIVEQSLKTVIRHPGYIIVIIIYVSIRIYAKKNDTDFFVKNRYASAFILCIWYATFDCYASYSVLTNPSRHLHFIMQTKSGKHIDVDKNVIYAGRTNDYWFLYNAKTKYVRAIRNSDIELVDFDSITSIQ